MLVNTASRIHIQINPGFKEGPKKGASGRLVRGGKKFVLQRNGAAGTTRTPNPLIRSQMLYPIELRLRGLFL